jgi:hypothetical protein
VLIPNQPGIHDSTTYSSERNDDSTYTISLGPVGSGQNGILTGTPFYRFPRAYSPVEGADMTVAITSHPPPTTGWACRGAMMWVVLHAPVGRRESPHFEVLISEGPDTVWHADS